MRPNDIKIHLTTPAVGQPFAEARIGSEDGLVTLTVATSNHRAMFCIDLSAENADAIALALHTQAAIVNAKGEGGKA